MNVPASGPFPGTLYDGDGTLMAGDGPEMTPDLVEDYPRKALITSTPGRKEVAVLQAGDRLWLLPNSFGTPPELPMGLLTTLANVVRQGGKVGLAARTEETYVLVRDALVLLLDESGGTA